MRILRLSLIVLLFASLAAAQTTRRKLSPSGSQKSSTPSQELQEDMEAISKLHDKDIEASLALDEAVLESLWTDDVVTMHPGMPPIVGKDANVANLKAGIERMKDQEIMAYNEQFQEVRIQGDWAYEWGSITGRTRPFSGGKEVPYHLNVMRILQRQPDGSWKIARSIYNNAEAQAAPLAGEQKPKPDEKNKLEE